MKIIKRNGEEAVFDISKIATAITKANNQVPLNEQLSREQIQAIAGRIADVCSQSATEMNVEAIQDLVEKEILKQGAFSIAKLYITYRYRHETGDMLKALAAISERSERQLPPPVSNFAGIVGAEPYPVTRKAQELLKRLIMRGVARFRSLFKGNRSRSEVVATFLAILELGRVTSVRLEQTDLMEDDVDVVVEKMPEESS